MNQPLLSNKFLQKYVGKQPQWGFNGLGYVVYKRTYARTLFDDKGNRLRTEEWWETLQRCIEGAQKIGAGYTKEEAERLFHLLFHLKGSFAGRCLWQLGTSTVDRFGGNSLLNCWATTITKPEDFCFIYENLMLGGGVGYSVKREHIHDLPKVKQGVQVTLRETKDADFIVPDSREGWVELMRKVLDAFFKTGKSFSYSTILVRGAGEPIRGFGGVASGSRALVQGIEQISTVLKGREGKKLRSIDALDVANIIGSIVVSGNVRRSAQISIGDPDDILFLRAKRWDLGNVPNWRAMSNNSIYVDRYDQIMDEVWNGYVGNGEPYGFINLKNSQRYGRLGEKVKDNCECYNPCAEISLADKECCNLSELFINNIESKEELMTVATLLYKAQKAICALNFIHPETEEIVHKNFRIGVGVTGICQVGAEKLAWLDEAYRELRKFDKEWSKERGWPQSIKLTTVKPSGTLSLLGGATPGVHPAYSQYWIRRVRMATGDMLVPFCRELGYHVEYVKNFDGTDDHSTMVVEFPCAAGSSAQLAKDVSAVRQLELVKKLQTVWADNSVSVTVYYKKEELPEIKAWLKENLEHNVKTVSFLLHSDHGFRQAPYEEITKERYDEITRVVKPLQLVVDNGVGEIYGALECAGGACPVR